MKLGPIRIYYTHKNNKPKLLKQQDIIPQKLTDEFPVLNTQK